MNVDEFPPISDVFANIPRNDTQCYDLETHKLTQIQSGRLIKYIIINAPYEYKISNTNDSDENTLALFIFAMPRDLYSDSKHFDSYVAKLVMKFFLESEYKDVNINIKCLEKCILIEFTLDGIFYSKLYRSKSSSLTEVLLYEYFKYISQFNYSNLFEYSDRFEFRIKYSELSILEFIEKCFMDIYGHFKSVDTNIISELLNDIKELKPVSGQISENISVENDIFKIFFSDYVCNDEEFQLFTILSRTMN